jgi:tetratricopeptide (TPR) repeat protein
MRRLTLAASVSLYLSLVFVTTSLAKAQEPQRSMQLKGAAVTAPARIQDAIDALEPLLEQARKAGDRGAEANTIAAIANSYRALHQQQKAIEQFQSALIIWRQLANREHEASTLAHIGDVYREWGFPEQANRFYRDALVTYPAGDKAGRGATLNNISLTYFSMNNRKKCFESLEESLAIFRELHDLHGEALALANLGAAYVFLVNDPMKAVAVLQDAVTKLEILNDRDSEAGVLDKMGVAWHNLGKSELAGLSFQHALALFQQVGDTQGIAAVQRHMRTLGEQETQASSR